MMGSVKGDGEALWGRGKEGRREEDGVRMETRRGNDN